ncbi:MAG: DEAD/DEAH box helicase family protein [Paludibacteraceae bacterium]|nr:DEAD/DEAH box helicase family protein [Paludibacteraceae bacterium]
MDESTTRRKKIDPALYAVGWEQVPESEILNEQRAYEITPGRVERVKARRPKKVDYILEYKGLKLAVIEAKSDETDVAIAVPQAKLYAEMLQIRYTYATNGDQIYFIDMGVKDSKGEYIIPSSEKFIDCFPSPQELWLMTFPDVNVWRDKFNAQSFNRDGGRDPRYYQINAINNVLNAVANEQNRILLTMATGTGKTYTAFQICWKLFQTKWNLHGNDQHPRILFISDRNILANQAVNDFEQFPEDAMVRITAESLRKTKDKSKDAKQNKVPTSRHLYFTIFQTFMCDDGTGQPYYKQYPADFFDFIIIDECHRGGANDESQWRELMDYFSFAYQLGMTATPRRHDNANTYRYFGDPVYSYSLKQGIADGFLTPFRVRISESNIDTYIYDPDDDVEGDIDPNKIYTEKDFYNGDIIMRQRDEHRVKELLDKINPTDKTIIFCCTQLHAHVIRDMVNQHKKHPASNYCQRVTANDGKDGEETLRLFQDNEKSLPVILTTSQKLSTGVDARNVRNIVLLRPVNNMIEFKQIIGRGTRLFDDKFYFTIYDFVGANKNFQDAEWDGDPFCPICGNYPCTCEKKLHEPCSVCGHYPCICNHPVCPKCGEWPCACPPEPCPVCGHLPCTCPGGGQPKPTIKVRLSAKRELALSTKWTEKFQYGEDLISIDEFVKILFGRLPEFFSSQEDLHKQWQHPSTRQALLDHLEREGFAEEKLRMVQRVMEREDCDLLDVLDYLAYATTPIERRRRVELVRQDYYQTRNLAQQQFLDFLMQQYIENGEHQFTMENLPTLIDMKYGTAADAVRILNMRAEDIKKEYVNFQKALYPFVFVKNTYNLNGNIGTVIGHADNINFN